MARYGLDLSENNEGTMRYDSSWEALKNSKYTDFIILRRGFGVNPEEDTCYLNFYQKAKDIGIHDISSYWFSYALDPSEAKIEAENYLKMTEKDGLLLNAVIMDFEDNNKYKKYGINITSKFVNGQIEAFIKPLKEAGLNTAVYSSEWILTDLLDWDLVKELGFGIWNASYNPIDNVKGWIWQFTESEYINGIGPFDANVMY